MKPCTPALLAAVLLAGCGENAFAPGDTEEFEWTGVIEPGQRLEIKGINGAIVADPTASGTARVEAVRRGRDDDPASVDIEVLRHAGGVTVCAVYPNVPGQPANRCLPGLQGQLANRDNDVQVDFAVRVPAGVAFRAVTVNGAIAALGLDADVSATTVNGAIDVETDALAEATTVNGAVRATIGSPFPDRTLAFTAVNGNVTVEVPANTNARAVLTTVTGSLVTDFPLTGTPNARAGTLGFGGPDLVLASVSGNVALRRGPPR